MIERKRDVNLEFPFRHDRIKKERCKFGISLCSYETRSTLSMQGLGKKDRNWRCRSLFFYSFPLISAPFEDAKPFTFLARRKVKTKWRYIQVNQSSGRNVNLLIVQCLSQKEGTCRWYFDLLGFPLSIFHANKVSISRGKMVDVQCGKNVVKIGAFYFWLVWLQMNFLCTRHNFYM